MTDTHTYTVKHGDTPVKITIEGLSEPAAQAVAEFADTLTQRLALIEGHERRRAAHRVETNGGERQPFTLSLTEAQRLDRARRGELGSRPVTAEIYASPHFGGAVLRLLGQSGGIAYGNDVIRLEIERWPKDGALTPEALNAAGAVLARRGFNYARGAQWAPSARKGSPHPTRPDTARVAIVPTAAYLAYVERRFGPEPEFTAPAGMNFKRVQRGMWTHTDTSGLTLRLTWSPALDGDAWRLWREDGTGKPRIVSRGRGADGATMAFSDRLTADSE